MLGKGLPQGPTQQSLIESGPESAIIDLENKLEKNRERNRAHAKRTRMRKKELMETMKTRIVELQREVIIISTT